MVCSICKCSGHNKRTCPQRVMEKAVVATTAPPTPTLTIKPSSIEIEIGLLSIAFDLPKEVMELIKKAVFWGDWKPSNLPLPPTSAIRTLNHYDRSGRHNSIQDAIRNINGEQYNFCPRSASRTAFGEVGNIQNKLEMITYFEATERMSGGEKQSLDFNPNFTDGIVIHSRPDRAVLREIRDLINHELMEMEEIESIPKFYQAIRQHKCWLEIQKKPKFTGLTTMSWDDGWGSDEDEYW